MCPPPTSRPPAPIDERNLPLNQVFEYPTTGLGVTIYMADTGILGQDGT